MKGAKNIPDMENYFQHLKPPFDDEKAVAKAKANVMRRIETSCAVKSQRKPKKTFRWVGAAAALILLFASAGVVYQMNFVEVINSETGYRQVVLPDHSKVDLAHGAAIKYNKLIWNWNRSLTFYGVGYFEITEGSRFAIRVPEASIEILGTSFTVWASDNNLMVHCTSGRIKVKRKNDEVVLEKFDFTATVGEKLLQKAKYNTNEFIDFGSNHLLNFNSVPLGIVIKELEMQKDIRIKSSLSPELLYTGTLNTTDIESCLKVLCKPFGATFSIKADAEIWIYYE